MYLLQKNIFRRDWLSERIFRVVVVVVVVVGRVDEI